MLTLHFAGLRFYKGKKVVVKVRNIVILKRTTVAVLERWDTVYYLLERNIVYFRNFFQQHQTFQLQPKTFVIAILWVQERVLEET